MHYFSASEVKISVGSSYLNGTRGFFYRSFRLIRHPAYHFSSEPTDIGIKTDIAVVRVFGRILFYRFARPIPLGRFFVEEGDNVMVTGKICLN